MSLLADRQMKEKLLQMIMEAAVSIRVSQGRNKQFLTNSVIT